MEPAPRPHKVATPVSAHTVLSSTPLSALGAVSSRSSAPVTVPVTATMTAPVTGPVSVASRVGVAFIGAPGSGAAASGGPRPHAVPDAPQVATPAVARLAAVGSADQSERMPPGVPARWDVPAVTLPRLLADAVRDFPSQVALLQRDGVEITHVQFVALVDRLALALHARDVRRVVVVDPRPLAAVVMAQAAWRLGIPIVLGSAAVHGDPVEDEPVDGGTVDGGSVDGGVEDGGVEDGGVEDTDPVVGQVVGMVARVPDWDAGHDMAVGVRRSLSSLGVPAERMVVDDLTRVSTGGEVGAARLGTGLRRVVRQLGQRDRASLTGMIEAATQGALPAVSPDAIAVVYQCDGSRHEFTHHNLVAAAFQVRLWIPDMAAGTERVAAAMSLHDPVAFVVGPVLAVLTAATLCCDDHPTTTIAGATVAFGSVALWRQIAHRPRWGRPLSRRDGSPSSLRVGGVVTTAATDLLPSADVRAVVALTQGARLRHFWTSTAAAGPVAAQPVYGRVLGMPGAEPLTETVVHTAQGQVLAAGPQFARGAMSPIGWATVTGAVPPPVTAPRKDVT